MYIAVFYTGALRTVDKTMKHFKRNIVLHNNVHIYACLENDSSLTNDEWEARFKHEFGDNMKRVIWKSNKHDSDWNSVKKVNMEHVHFPIGWANKYLNDSGSMFEHYQMQTAYKVMVIHENEYNFKYDYIIRCRTDTIFSRPIDFHWLNYSDEQLKTIITTVSAKLREHNIMKDITPYLMYYMINEDILDNVHNIQADIRQHESYKEFLGNCETIFDGIDMDMDAKVRELNHYIKYGKYILGFRCNLLYICRREYFHIIPLLGTAYGLLKHPQIGDDYWWNSESQFEAICYHAGLSIFNYCSDYEGASVYSFQRDKYFDENNEIKEKSLIFCLVRN